MASERVESLIGKLEKGGLKTQEILGSLAAGEWSRILYDGPPAWNVRDLLAHLVSAEPRLLQIAQDVAAKVPARRQGSISTPSTPRSGSGLLGGGTPLSNSITSWAQTKGQLASYFLKGVPPPVTFGFGRGLDIRVDHFGRLLLAEFGRWISESESTPNTVERTGRQRCWRLPSPLRRSAAAQRERWRGREARQGGGRERKLGQQEEWWG